MCDWIAECCEVGKCAIDNWCRRTTVRRQGKVLDDLIKISKTADHGEACRGRQIGREQQTRLERFETRDVLSREGLGAELPNNVWWIVF